MRAEFRSIISRYVRCQCSVGGALSTPFFQFNIFAGSEYITLGHALFYININNSKIELNNI